MADEKKNPYESPIDPGIAPSSALSGEVAPWSRWLVFTSLVLAVLFEVLPTEIDFIACAAGRSILLFLTARAICMSVILIPVVLYVWINGWRGLTAVKARVIAIGIIVGLNRALDTYALVDHLLHK